MGSLNNPCVTPGSGKSPPSDTPGKQDYLFEAALRQTSPRQTSMQVLSRRLIRFRMLRGLRQRTLAFHAGLSRKQLNVLESGQQDDALVSTIERLANSLAVTPDALLGYESLPLVRQPVSAGYVAATVREWSSSRVCPECGTLIPGRELHLLGECILNIFNSGQEPAAIARTFGLRTAAVESILEAEFQALRIS